jgi:hypothetical protein
MSRTYAQTLRTAVAVLALSSLLVTLTPCVPGLSTAMAKNPLRRDRVRVVRPADDATNKMRISEAYGKLPMSFEPNRGQADRRAKFLSRGAGYNLFLTRTEASLALYKNEEQSDSTSRTDHSRLGSVVRMRLKGANTKAKIEGLEQLQGKSNYLIGNDRTKWHTNIPTFAQVKYTGIYPGIDVVYYGQQRQLEYDFRLAPGADSSKIRIAFEGAENLSIDADGNLVLKTSGGEIIQHAPTIYQESETGRQSIAGCYVLRGEHEIGFEVSAYDRSKPLVLDPQLTYSTYYGGNALDFAAGIAVDNAGNAYIAGSTESSDLTLKQPFATSLNPGGCPTPAPCSDVFVTKLNSAGTDIVYSTYLGSNSDDDASAIAVTTDGKACITGGILNLFPNNFPLKNQFQGNGSIFDPTRDEDAFLTVLTADGSNLAYSTFFGGTGFSSPGGDFGRAIAVDSTNKVYIAGASSSNSLPTKNPFQSSRHSADFTADAFIAKFDPSQSGNASLIYSSYLGGGDDDIANGIAVDGAGNAYVVGFTRSTDLIIRAPDSLGPLQTANHGSADAFVAKIDTNSSSSASLVYSTYFGGSGFDEAFAVAVDSSQRAYVTGSTDSTAANFPTKHPFQPNNAGGKDAFVAKFNANGSALFYSTFLGGIGADEGRGIAIDSAGNAYVTGQSGTGFPELNGLPSSIVTGSAFITKIEHSDATGTTIPSILYSDTFGGSSGAIGNAIALDSKGNVYVAGSAGANLQTTGIGVVFQQQPFQPANKGGIDAFAVKIESTFPDTIGLFRPSTGQFLLRNSNTTGNPDLTLTFGQAGDKPLVGDWNGDGVSDIGVFRSGTFLLATVQTVFKAPCLFCVPVLTTTLTSLPQFSFGPSGGLPIAGDWNGDGIDSIGVFSNGTFQLRNSNTAGSPDLSFAFGQTGDLPVAGDWNGDGIDTIGVFRPPINTFLLRNSNTGGAADISFPFGIAEDLPLAGDWNGDGIDTIGVLRPSVNTFFLSNVNALDPASIFFFNFGQGGDVPLAGDWNGRPDPFNLPNSGINDPSSGGSGSGQIQTFTTTCSDPDGWHDIATIDFKIAKSDGNGNGVPIALWVQFNENTNLIRFYDPDTQTWSQGEPGSNVVLSSRFAELHLADTIVLGSGPTGPSVQIMWSVVFKDAAIMNNYKQYLKITDDAGLTTGFDKVGSWSVSP